MIRQILKKGFCVVKKESTFTMKKGDLSNDMLVSLSMGHLNEKSNN